MRSDGKYKSSHHNPSTTYVGNVANLLILHVEHPSELLANIDLRGVACVCCIRVLLSLTR